MSVAEFNKMVETGKVQPPFNGSDQSYVSYPASSKAFEQQAKVGTVYVTYRVPASSVVPTSRSKGWAYVAGPSSFASRLATRQGKEPFEFPKATFIVYVRSK
jgi:hypothetical protein